MLKSIQSLTCSLADESGSVLVLLYHQVCQALFLDGSTSDLATGHAWPVGCAAQKLLH